MEVFTLLKYKIWDFLMNKYSLAICNPGKKLTSINGILASATFVSVKAVGQEQKWVDLADND